MTRCRVGIMGAGAVGCYVGGLLHGAPDVEVVFVGRPRMQEEIAASGLTLLDLGSRETRVPAGEVAFETEPGTLADCDVILCCVKSGHTDEVARSLDDVLAPGALVMSLQNGVHNVAALRRHLGDRPVLAGIVGFNVVPQGGGVFRHTTKGPLMIEPSDDARARAVIAGLRAAELDVDTPADIVRHQWTKLLVNLNNAVSALSGAPTRDMVVSPGYRRVVAEIMREGIAVLRAAAIRPASLRGIPMSMLPRLLALPTPLIRLASRAQIGADPEARSSMWVDLSKGRKTEIDFLNGEIVRLAEEHGVAAPLNRRIVELVHEAEAAGSGPPDLPADELHARLHAPS